MVPNPFPQSRSRPGHGEIHLTLLPPSTPSFRILSFTYPLKIVSSTPHTLRPSSFLSQNDSEAASPAAFCSSKVPLLFLLSYGGGLLPPDSLSVSITLDPNTRLTIITQGSTKIFPSPPTNTTATATQSLSAHLSSHSALLLSPDPTQPFAASYYAQTQSFTLADATASLCMLDWVVEGRRARGESWAAGEWRGRNEVWLETPAESFSGLEEAGRERALLLRDSVILRGGPMGHGQTSLRHEGIGVFGTVILVGPVFRELGEFFVEEFAALPRIGGRDWGDGDENVDVKAGSWDPAAEKRIERIEWRNKRVEMEKKEAVLWTASKVRGSVLVKFGAKEVQGARRWLREMWAFEGTVAREFGEGGMMSLR